MIKIGTDICSVNRIASAYERWGRRFLERILTDREIEYVLKEPAHTATRIAGRFAAKEATSKALGTGWNGVSWKEVEIGRRPSGEPNIKLTGRAATIAQRRGVDTFEVSLSHEKEYAVAFVLAYLSTGKHDHHAHD